jgi:hypothetical protein
MSNIYLDRAKESIMDWFRERGSKVGHVIMVQEIIRLRTDEPNPKVADCFADALKSLESDGLIETKSGMLSLTQVGYDSIFDKSDDEYMEQAKEFIMDWFCQRKSRVGDAMSESDIIHYKNDIRNPKIANLLIKAINELVGEGLLEIKKAIFGECCALTQKGYDAIY